MRIKKDDSFLNRDSKTIKSFGDEWNKYDQSDLSFDDSLRYFNEYFNVFPWHKITKDSVGFDMGCGTGRWAKHIASKVGLLNCIEPSDAINIARKNLGEFKNVCLIKGDVNNPYLKNASQDFGYSLGVLHHIPDTEKAIEACVKLLKPGAPFLIYIYYFFEDRPLWYKYLWLFSNIFRKIISKLPRRLKNFSSDFIALTIYLPLAKLSKFLENKSLPVKKIPLSYYRNSSFYTMRTDALDRFGTPLEKRFTKKEIKDMCLRSGLVDIRFSDSQPFWCCVGYKKDRL